MSKPSVTARTVNDIADMIREVDRDNRMTATNLGATLASRLCVFYGDLEVVDVIDFVVEVNPDKTLGAGRLAGLIVEEFQLDEEG